MSTTLGIDETININIYCRSASAAKGVLEHMIQAGVVCAEANDGAIGRLLSAFVPIECHDDLPEGTSECVYVGDIRVEGSRIENTVVSLWDLSSTYCIQMAFKLGDVSRGEWHCISDRIASFCDKLVKRSGVVAALAGVGDICYLEEARYACWLMYSTVGPALARITVDGIIVPD